MSTHRITNAERTQTVMAMVMARLQRQGRHIGDMSPDAIQKEVDDAVADLQEATRAIERSITCPRCGLTSYHPRDIEEGYCGRCKEWWRGAAATYRDDWFPERPCDRCGQPYRGPAVYCSLACAVADA